MTAAALLGLALASDPFSLEWTAPDGCPTSDAITERIAAAVGDVEGPPLRARAEIVELEDQTFSLTLTLGREGEPEGLRTLEGPTCVAVSDAAILIVAIAIDPNAASALTPPDDSIDPIVPAQVPAPPPEEPEEPEEPPPEEPEEPPPEEPEEPPPAEPRDPTPTSTPAPVPEPARQLAVDLAGNFGVGLGILPSVGGALGLHTALHGPLWRIELGATYETPRETSAASTPDVRGAFQLWSVDLRGCPVLGRNTLTVPLCLGVRAGLMHGVGRGVADPAAAASPWVAVSAAPTLLWRPRSVADQRLLLGVRAEASVSLTRPGFATTAGSTSTEVYEAGPVGGQVGALVGVRLR
jgi:hypothetical protein